MKDRRDDKTRKQRFQGFHVRPLAIPEEAEERPGSVDGGGRIEAFRSAL